MKALLLLAGCGSRLCKYTENTPKTLLNVGGKPILQHIMDRVITNNITDFVIVVGFQKEKIVSFLKSNYPNIKFKFIENESYARTNTLYSMWLARDELKEDFLYFHGDLIFNKDIVKNLLDTKHKNGAVVEPHKESMEVYGFDNIITKMSKKKDSIGKALGIYRFSSDATERLFEEAGKIIDKGNLMAFQSEAMNHTLVYHRMDLVSTNGLSWIEVDEEEDLLEAERVLKKILIEESQ